jgi:TIR domain-containing protein
VKIFLSYSHTDSERAAALKAGLELLGHDVWIDEKIEGGRPWRQRITEEIDDCDSVVLALSDASLASWECHEEWAIARKLRKHLLPVRVTPLTLVVPAEISELHILDGTCPGEEFAFRLARALRSRAPSSAGVGPTVVAGAALGGVSLMHLGFVTGLYPDVLGDAKAIVVFNLILAIGGFLVCVVAGARRRAAIVGAAFCLIGAASAVTDGVHIGMF